MDFLNFQGSVTAVADECVCCGVKFGGQARAIFPRRAILFPEERPEVWKLSQSVPSVVERLCRRKKCALFLENPVLRPVHFPNLPELNAAQFEDSIYHKDKIRFISGTVIEKAWPVREQTFFLENRSREMQQFFRNDGQLLKFFRHTDAHGLRCVGCWSSQDEIDAVYHYACLFAQEAVQESRIWVPYWYRDARLIGVYRIAYLIKCAESYQGAVMMDVSPQYQTLSWVWLTPQQRRRGIFRAIWHRLEKHHPSFKVLAPLSGAMRAFLAREDAEGNHEIVEETGGCHV